MLLLLGCLRAVHPVEDLHPDTLAGRFVVEQPQGWDVHRNRRAWGNHHLTMHSPDGSSAITVELIREDRASRELPLSLVADVLPIENGRGLGIESTRLSQVELTVADREAWATTVLRRHGPNERLVSMVVLRGDRHLAILTLYTREGAEEGVLLAWSQVLDSFVLPYDPAPEAPFLEDLRFEEELETAPGP